MNPCTLDPNRQQLFQDVITGYGIPPSGSEWFNNCLSSQTVMYSCGAIARRDAIIPHDHDPDEFDRCQRLAYQAAALMERIEIGMGSESTDYLFPFFITVNRPPHPPYRLTATGIRTAFGGTIDPQMTITLEPLTSQTDWWQAVLIDLSLIEEPNNPDAIAILRRWENLVTWFNQQSEFTATAFVKIGSLQDDTTNLVSVFPRLWLGLTSAGSLVGICSFVVST